MTSYIAAFLLSIGIGLIIEGRRMNTPRCYEDGTIIFSLATSAAGWGISIAAVVWIVVLFVSI